MSLTERQWRNRIQQRRELVTRAAGLEERICTALETRNASLDDVNNWLLEVDGVHEKLRTFGYSATRKEAFTHEDLVERLGTSEERQVSEQRQAAARAEKAARDADRTRAYDAERLSYPRLAQPPKCVHPERLHCDYYGELPRCEFMKFGGTPGYWVCIAGEKVSSK